MTARNIFDIPSHVPSYVYDYFPSTQKYLNPPAGNTSLLAGPLVCSHFAGAARPKLWAHTSLPTQSLKRALTLLDILSTSPEIQSWIQQVDIMWRLGPRRRDDDERIQHLVSLVRHLPAVKILHLQGARMQGIEGDEEIPGFSSYPVELQAILFECTFPRLSHLHIENLHSVPYPELLRLSPHLEVLEVTQLTTDRWPEKNRPPPFPVTATQGLAHHPIRRLIFHGYHLAALLDPRESFSPIPALRGLRAELTHFSLFGWMDTQYPNLWSDSIVSMGKNLQYLAFTLDKGIVLSLSQDRSNYNYNAELLEYQSRLIPGMNNMDLANLPHLKELEIAFLGGQGSSLNVNQTMDQIASLISTSMALKILKLHVVHEWIRQDPPPAFQWPSLDQVLCNKRLDVKVSVARIHQFTVSAAAAGLQLREDAGWRVIRMALPMCWERGHLEFRRPTGEYFR
ncbi:hypothetical protein DL96DRAFT_1638006 [Flagelloscypha sp. PMI_526]|nr:hypothetical protein DL96DRAFT_1638006 [Flagelloscypha sp. PMI_526]